MTRPVDNQKRTPQVRPWWLHPAVARALPLFLVALGLIFSGYVFHTVRMHHDDIERSVADQNRIALRAAAEHLGDHFEFLRNDLILFAHDEQLRDVEFLRRRHEENGVLDVFLVRPGDPFSATGCLGLPPEPPLRREIGRHLAAFADAPRTGALFSSATIDHQGVPALLYSVPIPHGPDAGGLVGAVLGRESVGRILELGSYATMTAVVSEAGVVMTCPDYPASLRSALEAHLGEDPRSVLENTEGTASLDGWETLASALDFGDGRHRWMVYHYDLSTYQYNHGWSGPLDAFGPALGLLLIALLGAAASWLILRRERERYEHLQDRWWASHVLSETLQGTVDAVGAEYFRALVAALARTLKVKYCLVAELVPERDSARTLAVWAGHRHVDDLEYPLRGTPCAEVAVGGMCLHPSGVQELFPDDHLLVEMDVESYHGTPIYGTDGEALGLLVTLDERPMDEEYRRLGHLLELFAARAAAELQRQRAERNQARHRDELERRVEERSGELAAAQDRLVEAEKMAALGSLVAGVAHEINTPVGVGVTAATHLRERAAAISAQLAAGAMTRSDLDRFLAEAVEAGEILHTNLDRAAELINSFKQVAVDQSSEERRTFNVKGYFEEVLVSLGPPLHASSHTVTLDCPDDLVIHTFPGPVSQIMTNLIMNSLIHGYEGRENGRILIRARFDDRKIHVEYRDDGCGMTEEVRARVFEPFFTTKRGQQGSGLGMHIVYNLVTQTLKGHIHLESAPRKGCVVSMTFPVPDYALGQAPLPEACTKEIVYQP